MISVQVSCGDLRAMLPLKTLQGLKTLQMSIGLSGDVGALWRTLAQLTQLTLLDMNLEGGCARHLASLVMPNLKVVCVSVGAEQQAALLRFCQRVSANIPDLEVALFRLDLSSGKSCVNDGEFDEVDSESAEEIEVACDKVVRFGTMVSVSAFQCLPNFYN